MERVPYKLSRYYFLWNEFPQRLSCYCFLWNEFPLRLSSYSFLWNDAGTDAELVAGNRKIRLHLHHVPWDHAACTFADMQKLDVTIEGGIRIVKPRR